MIVMKTLVHWLWCCALLLCLAIGLIIGAVLTALAGHSTFTDVLPQLTVLGVLSGALVALAALLINLTRGRSHDNLMNTIDLLERAYQVLAQSDPSGVPPNRRENWIAAARFLKSAEDLSGQIVEPSHRRVYEDRLLHWRLRFHDLIQPTDEGFPETYFAERTRDVFAWGQRTRPPLALASLAVLYRFIRFPESYADPLKKEPLFSSEEIHRMKTFGPKALGRHLVRVEEARKSDHMIDRDIFEFQPESTEDGAGEAI
jgi:hypothetical protein